MTKYIFMMRNIALFFCQFFFVVIIMLHIVWGAFVKRQFGKKNWHRHSDLMWNLTLCQQAIWISCIETVTNKWPFYYSSGLLQTPQQWGLNCFKDMISLRSSRKLNQTVNRPSRSINSLCSLTMTMPEDPLLLSQSTNLYFYYSILWVHCSTLSQNPWQCCSQIKK